MNDPILQAFRDQIDAIDLQLFALLKARSLIVQQVGHHKMATQQQTCFIRPGREYSMVRNMVAADTGPFPKSHLYPIWRLMIAGSTNIEQRLSVSAFAPPEHRDFFWLAREYFGPTTPIAEHNHSTLVIQDLAEGKALIGFLPWPKDGTDDWWLKLAATPDLNLFAAAPLIADSRVPMALLVGDVAPEPTGHDRSWIVIDGPPTITHERIGLALRHANLYGERVAEAPFPQHDGHRCHLYSIEGFYDRQNAIASLLSHTLDGCRVTSIGSYALPLTTE